MHVTADVFPANVALAPVNTVSTLSEFRPTYRAEHPDGTRYVTPCRVIIANDTILIAVDSPTGPTLVFREGITEYLKDKVRKEHYVTTTSGKSISFIKDNNCGCGSRLRSWSPFGNIMLASNPEDF